MAKKSKKDQQFRAAKLNFLLDIPLQLTVELGKTRMLLADVLALADGSVVELDRLANEPLDIKINDKLIAYGEAVVVNETIGIKVTEILEGLDAELLDIDEAV